MLSLMLDTFNPCSLRHEDNCSSLRPSCFCCADLKKNKKRRRNKRRNKCGGITQWVKVIIWVNEVNLLLVCQCGYLELVEEEES